jgi:hydrogenase large subunit
MTRWGRSMFVTPGVVVDGKLVTTDLVEINLGIRILLGSSYYDDWEGKEVFVKNDPLGNKVDVRHPVEPAHAAATAEARLRQEVQLGDVAALVRRQGSTSRSTRAAGPLARLWTIALAGLVDIATIKANRQERRDELPAHGAQAREDLRVEGPEVVEHDRARPRAYLLPGLSRPRARCTSSRRRSPRCARATPKTWEPFKVPTRASAVASPRRCAACSRTTS